MITVQSCSNIIMGGLGTIAGTSYQDSDIDITDADVEYARLETGLLLTLKDIEMDNLGYDEYRYNLDGVGHDSHELLAYLTAKYRDFKVDKIKGEIQRIFNEQYKLSLKEIIETYTTTETVVDPDAGESYEIEVDHEKKIFLTTLVTRPLSEVLKENLDREENPQEESKFSFVFVLLILGIVGGGGYYFKIYKPKHEDFDDEYDEDEMGYQDEMISVFICYNMESF